MESKQDHWTNFWKGMVTAQTPDGGHAYTSEKDLNAEHALCPEWRFFK